MLRRETASVAGEGHGWRSDFDILKPGRNCWRVAEASRGALLADAANYFAALEAALPRATRSIVIVGWDFDASIRLRGDAASESPTLGAYLRALVEERPELQVRILIWNLSTVHAPGAMLPLLLGEDWQDHPRIKLRLDTKHPIYGAQHRKIVCIDDSIAFVGGIDLTVQRWDTEDHTPGDPRRIDAHGSAYEPVHDLQMAVEGEAAATVAELAYENWEAATGEAVAERPAFRDIWPPDLRADFANAPVAIARSAPRRGIRRGIREIEALNHAALRAAREAIYIEAQYFADRRIGKLLAGSLRREDGPEIVVLVARSAHGFIEGWIMNGNRERVLRLLKRADRHGRLRIVHPVVATPDGDCAIFVHSKLVIVDDRFIRVGSSNLNRRSTGLDVECDLAVEALDAAMRKSIAHMRARLLGEHLGTSADRVNAVFAEEGSLLRAIDRLSTEPRTLRRYNGVSRSGSTRLMAGTRLLDPRRPFRIARALGSSGRTQFGRWGQRLRQWISDSAKRMVASASGSR